MFGVANSGQQPSLMLNHKIQSVGARGKIWHSNSQIIFKLALNKLTNSGTLRKKEKKKQIQAAQAALTDE